MNSILYQLCSFAGPPQVDQPLMTKEVNVGEYVMLPCTVTGGTGRMEVTWLIDERPVEGKKDVSPGIKVIMSAALHFWKTVSIAFRLRISASR